MENGNLVLLMPFYQCWSLLWCVVKATRRSVLMIVHWIFLRRLHLRFAPVDMVTIVESSPDPVTLLLGRRRLVLMNLLYLLNLICGRDGPVCGGDEPICGRDGPVCGCDEPICGRDGPVCACDEPICGRDGPVCGCDEPTYGLDGPICGLDGPVCGGLGVLWRLRSPLVIALSLDVSFSRFLVVSRVSSSSSSDGGES